MKSHELAKKLLELPDLDVYTEVSVNHEYHTFKFEGDYKLTPTGLFLSESRYYVKGYSDKSPNDEPVIGTFMVYLNDGIVLKQKSGDNRLLNSNIKYFSNGESSEHGEGATKFTSHNNYEVFHRAYEKNIVLVTNDETYEIDGKQFHTNSDKYEIRTLKDIDFIKVLVSYDPNTWHPTYKNMSYEEAIAYGKSL